VILINTATFYYWPVEGIERERSVVLGLVFAAFPIAAGIGILRLSAKGKAKLIPVYGLARDSVTLSGRLTHTKELT